MDGWMCIYNLCMGIGVCKLYICMHVHKKTSVSYSHHTWAISENACFEQPRHSTQNQLIFALGGFHVVCPDWWLLGIISVLTQLDLSMMLFACASHHVDEIHFSNIQGSTISNTLVFLLCCSLRELPSHLYSAKWTWNYDMMHFVVLRKLPKCFVYEILEVLLILKNISKYPLFNKIPKTPFSIESIRGNLGVSWNINRFS